MNKRYLVMTLSLLLAVASPSVVLGAGNVDPTVILNNSDQARGNTAGLAWDVSIKATVRDSVSSRDLSVKAKKGNSLATFNSPPDVKGQMLLMRKNNMWFIKPGLSKPVSISPRQRLIGGASNADIASTNYANDYNAKILDTEEIGVTPCYVMDLEAKNSRVSYDRIKYWVSKDKNLGLKAEFYSVSGKLLKTATFKYGETVEINGKSKPFISEMNIIDALIKGSVTVMTYSNIETKNISEADFNLQTLVY